MKPIITMFTVCVIALVLMTGFAFADETEQTDSGQLLPPVAISDTGRYFQVTVNLASGLSHRRIGELYGQAVIEAVPDYEYLITSYMRELIEEALEKELWGWKVKGVVYEVLRQRINDIKGNLPFEYREEIEGFATVLKGDEDFDAVQKAYIITLLPDVARPTACSAFAVTGKRSATGGTIAARLLDWPGGKQAQMSKIQAVTKYVNGSKTIYSIGYLGFFGVLSGVNSHNVFGAILDSSVGGILISTWGHERSYNIELRYALENYATKEEAAAHIADRNKAYNFNHLIFLADAASSTVLENNVYHYGIDYFRKIGKREMRQPLSKLNNAAANLWHPVDEVLPVVNCFMNSGLDQNCDNRMNRNRLYTMSTNFLSHIGAFDGDNIKELVATPPYKSETLGGMEQGFLYNDLTQQIMIYEPANKRIEVFFAPRNGKLPMQPDYITIPLEF